MSRLGRLLVARQQGASGGYSVFRNRRAFGRFIEAAPEDTPPPVPGPFNLNGVVTDGDAVLTWTPSKNALFYRIIKDDVLGAIVDGSTFTYTDQNIAADTVFRYRIRAWVGDAGQYAESGEVSLENVTVVPSATIVWNAATATMTPQVGPAWTYARTGVKGFEDKDGILRYAPENEAVFDNCNRIQNFLSGTGTQSQTLRCRRYVVSVWGPPGAQIVVSGGASGTCTASASPSTEPSTSPLIIDVSSSSADTLDVTFTVSGSPTHIMCESGTVGSAYQAGTAYKVGQGLEARITCARAETPILSAGHTNNLMQCGVGWTNISAQNRSVDNGRSYDDSRLYQHKPTATATVVHSTNGPSRSRTSGTYRNYVAVGTDSTRGFALEIRNNTDSGSLYVCINPSTGAINGTFTTGTGAPTYVGASIRKTGQGYRLYDIAWSIAATKSISYHYTFMLNLTSSTVGDRSYTDTTSNYIELWGTFDYQSTDAIVNLGQYADGARGQDVISCTVGAAYTPGDCTLLWKGYVGAVPAGNRYLMGFSGSGPSLRVRSDNKVELVVGGLTLTSSNAIVPGTQFAVAARVKQNSHALCVDGTVVTSADAAVAGATTTLYDQADGSGANPSNGGRLDIQYIPTGWTNEQLQEYTGNVTPAPPSVVNGRTSFGHYITMLADPTRGSAGDGAANMTRIINYGISNFQGFRVISSWVNFETSLNTYSWTWFDNLLAQAAAAGKYVILNPLWVTFWGNTFYPSYVATSAGSTPQTANYRIAKIWEQQWMDHFIKVLVAIAGRYRSNPNFLGFLYEEISLGDIPERQTLGTANLYAAFYSQIKRIYPAVSAAAPELLQMQKFNWPYPPASSQNLTVIPGFLNVLKGLPWGGCMTWPDTLHAFINDDFTDPSGYTWYENARQVNANGERVAIAPCIETSALMDTSLAGTRTIRDDCYDNLEAQYLIWNEWAPTLNNTYFTTRVKVAVDEDPNGFNTNNPWD